MERRHITRQFTRQFTRQEQHAQDDVITALSQPIFFAAPRWTVGRVGWLCAWCGSIPCTHSGAWQRRRPCTGAAAHHSIAPCHPAMRDHVTADSVPQMYERAAGRRGTPLSNRTTPRIQCAVLALQQMDWALPGKFPWSCRPHLPALQSPCREYTWADRMGWAKVGGTRHQSRAVLTGAAAHADSSPRQARTSRPERTQAQAGWHRLTCVCIGGSEQIPPLVHERLELLVRGNDDVPVQPAYEDVCDPDPSLQGHIPDPSRRRGHGRCTPSRGGRLGAAKDVISGNEKWG
jgi:hypothetical protein